MAATAVCGLLIWTALPIAAARVPASFQPPAVAPLPVPRPVLPAPVAPVAPAPIPPPAPAPPTSTPTPGPVPASAGLGAGCIARLQQHDVRIEVTTIGPQPDPRCTIKEAVRLVALRLPDGAGVAFPDKPTIACETAATITAYVRDLLVPLAKGTYGSPVDTVWTGPGLDCRTRDHIAGAKLSAHAQGLAVDVARIRLGDGRTLEVGRPTLDLDKAFETAARAGACGYFHTSLGPGSDAFHETHWHFDLLPRGSGGETKICQ